MFDEQQVGDMQLAPLRSLLLGTISTIPDFQMRQFRGVQGRIIRHSTASRYTIHEADNQRKPRPLIVLKRMDYLMIGRLYRASLAGQALYHLDLWSIAVNSSLSLSVQWLMAQESLHSRASVAVQ